MFGLMLIDIESFNESKQASGYGVLLQKLLIEDMWVCREVVVGVLRVVVMEMKIVKRSKVGFRKEEAAIRADMKKAGSIDSLYLKC